MKIDGKVAIVTGAGGPGCGRAIARRFAKEGAAVVVSDVNDLGGAETVRLIRAGGGRAVFERADVSRVEELRSVFDSAEKTYGGVHILVNNASAPFRPGQPLEFWEEIVGVDLLGAMNGTRLAIDRMRARGGGAIVNMGSTSALAHGRVAPGGAPAYDVAKSGVMRLTTMLQRLAIENIRVNCLLPDWVDTPDVRSYWETLSPEQRKADGVPAKLTSLEQIADAVMTLVTDDVLAGRLMIFWSDDDAPKMIPFGDRGYQEVG